MFSANFSIAFQKLYKIHFLMIYYLGREKNLGVIEQAKKEVSESKGDGRSVLTERDITI